MPEGAGAARRRSSPATAARASSTRSSRRVEAGIALLGPEVKSLRAGQGEPDRRLRDRPRAARCCLVTCHISPYEQAGRENPDPRRERKLLLHRREIARLEGKLAERGFTLVPLALYWKDGRAKVELGLARGKKPHDKREAIRERETSARSTAR